MGALLLAFGIVGDWSKIGLIDTEAGSGELYVGETFDTPDGPITIGEYQYIRIDPEFTIQKYLNAFRLFAESGVEVTIGDSISHAWAGQGGLLDKQGKAADRGGNSYTAWRQLTPEHNALVDCMLQNPCHVIATMRSKTEYVMEANDKGKMVPKKVGMAPVQREGMEYEFTVMLEIDQKHIATTSKDRTNLFNGRYFQIAPSTGKALKDWLEKGAEAMMGDTELGLLMDEADKAGAQEALDELKIKATAAKPRMREDQIKLLGGSIVAASKRLVGSPAMTAAQAVNGATHTEAA